MRQKALDEVATKARLLQEQGGVVQDSLDYELFQVAVDQCVAGSGVVDNVLGPTQLNKTLEPVLRFNDSALMTAIKHKSWMQSRVPCGVQGTVYNLTLDHEMGLGFVGEATRLAIEYDGPSRGEKEEETRKDSILDDSDDDMSNKALASTPKRQREKKKKGCTGVERVPLHLKDKVKEIDLEEDVVMDLMSLGSSFITEDDDANDTSIESGSEGGCLNSKT